MVDWSDAFTLGKFVIQDFTEFAWMMQFNMMLLQNGCYKSKKVGRSWDIHGIVSWDIDGIFHGWIIELMFQTFWITDVPNSHWLVD